MGEMVDRVAAALKSFISAEMLDSGSVNGAARWDAMARAAIEAMMKPTPDMIAAGSFAIDDGIMPSHHETFGEPDKDGAVMVNVQYRPGIWRSMLTAALIQD